MDYFKKSCKELCEKLFNEEIATAGQLDDFVKTKCNHYNNSKDVDEENNAVINKEKAILKPIYDALEIKPNAETINKTYYTNADFTQDHAGIDNAKNEDKPLIYERAKKYAKYWKKLKNATDELGRRTNVKFFSIFLGVGTGQYYREASSKINTKLNGIKTNLERAKKALLNSAKEDPEQESPQPQPSDPGMFRGLPNGSTYCYLNTALQEPYHDLPHFRTKVLNAQVPDITTGQADAYKELRATQFFFKYLQDPNDVKNFKEKRSEIAKKLGYNGNQKTRQTPKERLKKNAAIS